MCVYVYTPLLWDRGRRQGRSDNTAHGIVTADKTKQDNNKETHWRSNGS